MKDNAAELRALAARYKMNASHFHKDGRGFIIVTRAGIEHICRVAKVTVTYTPVFEWSDPEKSRYVIECTARMGDVTTTSYGECAPANNRNPYPVAMAEKRAMSRAVLKLTGFYELNAKGEDEIESTNQTK